MTKNEKIVALKLMGYKLFKAGEILPIYGDQIAVNDLWLTPDGFLLDPEHITEFKWMCNRVGLDD